MTFRVKKNINVRLSYVPIAENSSPISRPFLYRLSDETKAQREAALAAHMELEQHIQNLEINTEYRMDVNGDALENIEELGSGSGGAVIKARHKTTGILVARKVRPNQTVCSSCSRFS